MTTTTTTAGNRQPAMRMARATLLTILGEIVTAHGGHAWQQSLVQALGALGTTPTAARQVVQRAARDGWVRSERVGRRSRIVITDDSSARLDEGRQRLFAFGAPIEWDERWLLVAYSIPEKQRDLRYQVRSRLTWLGFGSLGNGLWVSPHVGSKDEATRILASLDLPAEPLVFVTEDVQHVDPRHVVGAAWDLDAIRSAYEEFVREFSRARPTRPEDCFATWIRLVTAWRRLPGIDPELPDRLLPSDWPRARAWDLFQERYAAWQEPVNDYFVALEKSSE